MNTSQKKPVARQTATDPNLQDRIFTIRRERVILDSDLAEIYGVETKRLNEQVRRNADRFPEDFAFRLTRQEADLIQISRSQNATLKQGVNIKYLPRVFTEHGALMAAIVFNTELLCGVEYANCYLGKASIA